MAAAERYGVARPGVDRVIAVAERYRIACPKTVSFPPPSTTVLLLPGSDMLSLPLPRLTELPPVPPVME